MHRGWEEQHIASAGKGWTSHHRAFLNYESVPVIGHGPITAALVLHSIKIAAYNLPEPLFRLMRTSAEGFVDSYSRIFVLRVSQFIYLF